MRIKALLVACGALLVATGAAAAATPIVATSLTPRSVLFGDIVHARIDVTIDTRVDDLSTLTLATPLGPWSIVGPTRSTTSNASPFVRRSFFVAIACRSASCIPTAKTQSSRLPAAVVTIRSRTGKTVRLSAAWPSLVVESRLPTGAATATKPPFLLQTTPTRLGPRLSPRLLADLLDVIAMLLALGAGALVVRELRGRRVQTSPRVPDLERALRLVREAETRPPQDRRRALSLLARVIGEQDDGKLGDDAARAAWERDAPSPETLDDLARRTGDGL